MSGVKELGDAIQDVIHHYTLRGKFSSVHPELRREGIIRVEVGKEGLHFIRDTGNRKQETTYCLLDKEGGDNVRVLLHCSFRRG